MIKKYFFSMMLVIFFFIIEKGQAQTDTVKYGWTHSLVSGLNLTQVSFINWQQGGDNSLAFAFGIIGSSINDQRTTNWATNYKFAYGEAELSDKGVRKTDDYIDIQTVFTYKLEQYINPYGSISFKSQFGPGYKYNNDSANTRTAVSAFMDPGYLVEAVGLGFQPIKQLKTRVGLALKETFTNQYNIYSDDPATPAVEKTKVEGGVEWVTEAEIQLDDNILYKSKLEVFAPFKTFTVMTARWDNSIVAKVSKYINVNFGFLAIQDPVVTLRTQIKEGLALGLTYSVF